MALLHCDFYSDILDLSVSMYVILPELRDADRLSRSEDSSNRALKTLLLLHGKSDDHTAWVRKTAIERYAAPYGIAVIMPNVHRSYYTDMKYGLRYWSFISEELLQIARCFFPLSTKRKDNFVAGLSMGGYGAFKLALRKPDQFAAAASLSGALDVAERLRTDPSNERKWTFGDVKEFVQSDNNLVYLLQHVSKVGVSLPRLFQCCGTDDFLYQNNLNFRNKMLELGIEHIYEEDPGYAHDWLYWDMKIKRVLQWMFDR